MARRKKGKMGINALGDLEVDVMGIVWDMNTATVKDVFEVMYKRRGLAYTTIMTVMNRLAVKGILSQDKTSVPYVYQPLVAREDMATSMVREVVDRVLGGSTAAVMSFLIDDENIDAIEVEKLRKLIKRKESK